MKAKIDRAENAPLGVVEDEDDEGYNRGFDDSDDEEEEDEY